MERFYPEKHLHTQDLNAAADTARRARRALDFCGLGGDTRSGSWGWHGGTQVAEAEDLLFRFKATVSETDGAKVAIAEGSWIRNGIMRSASSTAIGTPDAPWIVATIDDEWAPTSLVLSAEAAEPSDDLWAVQRVIAWLEYASTDADANLEAIHQYTLGDIVDRRPVVKRFWYDYEAAGYTEADTPPAGVLAAGRQWYVLIDTVSAPWAEYHRYYQTCIPQT